MVKIRTAGQFQDSLDQEIGWRIKEISNIKLAAKSGGTTQKTFVRAGVPLVYAHWEGFVKRSSEAYINFVDNQGHSYSELKSCFAVFGLKGKLHTLSEGRKSQANQEALEFVMNSMGEKSKLQLSTAVNTEANLTSKVFENIAISLNISTTLYETKYHLIDESLVSRRNSIAHGEYLDLNCTDFLMLADDVLDIIRAYKTDLLNAAVLGQYMRAVN